MHAQTLIQIFITNFTFLFQLYKTKKEKECKIGQSNDNISFHMIILFTYKYDIIYRSVTTYSHYSVKDKIKKIKYKKK